MVFQRFHFAKPTIVATWFLTATQGNHYQWYFSDTALIGDSLQTLPIYRNGWYKVAVEDTNGCTQFSDSIFVNSLGLEEVNSRFSIFPNPFSETITIRTDNGKYKTFQLLSLDGKILREWKSSDSEQQLTLNQLASGTYILRIKGGSFQKKIIKN